MKALLMMVLIVLLGSRAAESQAAPASDNLEIAKAALKALGKEFGRPTTVMAPKLGSETGQLASSVGARESSLEAGMRCERSIKGIHCQLVEKGTNVILRSIRANGDLRVATFEIQRQNGDEHMSSSFRLVTLAKKNGRWEVLKIHPGPVA